MTRPEPIDPIRVGFIGCGAMARYHLDGMLRGGMADIVAVCEPSAEAYAATVALFAAHGAGRPRPTNRTGSGSWRRYADRLDAVVHRHAARPPLRPGDGLPRGRPRRPAREADGHERRRGDRRSSRRAIGPAGCSSSRSRAACRRRSATASRLLAVRRARARSSTSTRWSGRTGRRRRPGRGARTRRVSGGGFLFDTGAHMLNTVTDLAGEDFAEVAAWLEDDGRPVDIRAVVMGRLASGALVTMNACGGAIPSCDSDIRVFCDRGHPAHRDLGRAPRAPASRARRGCARSAPSPSRRSGSSSSNVRAGREPNPSPPEVGLRMARLWDAIRDVGRAAAAARPSTRPDASRASETAGDDDPGHRLERVPPGTVRRGRSGRSTRTASTRRSPTACAAAGFEVRTATLDEPEHGLTDAVLAETDVLTWWGHVAHDEVDDAVVDRVQRARPRRDGPDRPPLRPLLEDLPAADGHDAAT